MFLGGGVSGAGQASELALLSAAVRAWASVEAAGGGAGDPPTPRGESRVLWLSAEPRAAQASRAGVQTQNRVGSHTPGGGGWGGGGGGGAGGGAGPKGGGGGRNQAPPRAGEPPGS